MSPLGRKIRVMVVDDAVVSRLLVTEALHADPDLELAGTAANGQIALDKLDELAPDVIVLDVEMPVLNGLETLKAIRARHRRLPVVMFSTLTSRGQQTTLDALTYGASDYVTKPTTGSREESVRVLREELLPKLKALVDRAAPASAVLPAPRRNGLTAPVELVVIGCSTGGPNALADILPALPSDLSVPVVIVQHMPPMFTRLLSERLDRTCDLAVAEAAGGEVLAPGQVWIAQGGQHLTVVKDGFTTRLALDDGPQVNSCKPAVDVLFRSAAKAHGRGVLGVVLTGMGQDGMEGSRAVREAGGSVVIQDEPTSVVWGMARHVAEQGLADAVLPLPRIAEAITERVAARSRAVHAG